MTNKDKTHILSLSGLLLFALIMFIIDVQQPAVIQMPGKLREEILSEAWSYLGAPLEAEGRSTGGIDSPGLYAITVENAAARTRYLPAVEPESVVQIVEDGSVETEEAAPGDLIVLGTDAPSDIGIIHKFRDDSVSFIGISKASGTVDYQTLSLDNPTIMSFRRIVLRQR